MILRRAARFGKIIGFDAPFLAQVADAVIDEMGGHYTDLPAKRDYILQTITDEEERFHRTLSNGLRILDELMERMAAEGRTVISGQEAFHLWDTYGFPIDLTRDVAQDNGLTVDEATFRTTLAEAEGSQPRHSGRKGGAGCRRLCRGAATTQGKRRRRP